MNRIMLALTVTLLGAAPASAAESEWFVFSPRDQACLSLTDIWQMVGIDLPDDATPDDLHAFAKKEGTPMELTYYHADHVVTTMDEPKGRSRIHYFRGKDYCEGLFLKS